MSEPWKKLAQDEMLVVHLSDPHFGSKNAEEVWCHVNDFLKEQNPKPAMLLVTGDLVHSPDEHLYDRALEKLDSLDIEYYVCSGNHDRHKQGSRLTRDDVEAIFDVPYVSRATNVLRLVLGLLILVIAGFLSFVIKLWAGIAIGVLGIAVCWQLKRIAAWVLARKFEVGTTASVFDARFAGQAIKFDRVTTKRLRCGVEDWTLGLLALDSSVEVDFSARGKISTTDLMKVIDAAAEMGTKPDERQVFDLCILLVHHHLMPIRLLEPDRVGNATDLVNATCLVNAGTALERLSEARIDLVLHGHEHEYNTAMYNSLQESFGSVRVVAAGSATGNNSFTGCHENKATFNALIFAPDRSVRLRRVFLEAARWNQDEEILLFSPKDLRENWVRRRVMRDVDGDLTTDAVASSEITKSSIFTPERDIEVCWVMTDWLLSEPRFEKILYNSTGELVEPFIEFDSPNVGKQAVSDRQFIDFFPTGRDHRWKLVAVVPQPFRSTVDHQCPFR